MTKVAIFVVQDWKVFVAENDQYGTLFKYNKNEKERGWLIFPIAHDSILSPILTQKWNFPCHVLLLSFP